MDGIEQVRAIEVVPHNSQWEKEYLKEAEIISSIMKNEIMDIHHIGSTAILTIYAKPVIDILIEVCDISNVDNYNREMENLGYIAKGENGIEGRRFFIKGLYTRTHHVHIFQKRNPEITRHLNFRDYMIAHPKEAKHYGQLKYELAIKFRYDVEGYCNGKDTVIKDIDEKAQKWAKK